METIIQPDMQEAPTELKLDDSKESARPPKNDIPAPEVPNSPKKIQKIEVKKVETPIKAIEEEPQNLAERRWDGGPDITIIKPLVNVVSDNEE